MGNTTTGWYVPSIAGSTPVTSSLVIQNTLYVAKNGDDATALPNRLDKPFLTIYGASLVANAGDVIYVFSGTYDEGFNDWVKSDVIYDFQKGTLVQNVFRCITDSGIAKNIHIQGYGDFQQTGFNFSAGVVNITNVGSKLYLRCNNIISITNGILIFNIDTPYDIKVNNITVVAQYAINLRGVKNSGTIEFNEIRSSSQGVSIFMRNCNTDGQERDIYIKGKYIRTNQNSFSQGVIDFLNAFNTSAYINITFIDHYQGASGGIVRGDSGKCFLTNTNAIGVGYGYQATGTHIGFIMNSVVNAISYSLSVISNASVYVENTQLIATDTFATSSSVQVANNGQLTAKNCLIIQRGVSVNPCILNLLTPALKVSLSSCVLIGDSSNTESIRNTNGVPANIYIQEDCSTNLPTSSLITNQVTGTNVVVDSNINQNSLNFF